MASLAGYGVVGAPVQMAGPAGQNPVAVPGSDPSLNTVVIDGTPVRIVVLCVAAAAGLTALRFAGFKFNVGVST